MQLISIHLHACLRTPPSSPSLPTSAVRHTLPSLSHSLCYYHRQRLFVRNSSSTRRQIVNDAAVAAAALMLTPSCPHVVALDYYILHYKLFPLSIYSFDWSSLTASHLYFNGISSKVIQSYWYTTTGLVNRFDSIPNDCAAPPPPSPLLFLPLTRYDISTSRPLLDTNFILYGPPPSIPSPRGENSTTNA